MSENSVNAKNPEQWKIIITIHGPGLFEVEWPSLPPEIIVGFLEAAKIMFMRGWQLKSPSRVEQHAGAYL